MKTQRLPQIKRLHRVRLLEEEGEESALRAQQQRRLRCLEAIAACDAHTAEASRLLHASLHAGDREAAIAAEMAVAFDPLRRDAWMTRMAQLDLVIAERTKSWRASRMRRRQMEAVLQSVEAARRSEARLAEQKSLDAWFLSASRESSFADEVADESFQRELWHVSPELGEPTAKEEME